MSDTRDALGDRNLVAALVGGAAALGAALGGLFFALRDGASKGAAGQRGESKNDSRKKDDRKNDDPKK